MKNEIRSHCAHKIKIYKCPSGPGQSVRKLILRKSPFGIKDKKCKRERNEWRHQKKVEGIDLAI
jgi:hypothetical protein